MMNDSHSTGRDSGEPVAFGRRLAGSEAVQDDVPRGHGPGRGDGELSRSATGGEESKRLSRAGSLSYATESMRLTTRLMQLASWLLLQRAVNEGDISDEQARHERAKVKLGGVSSSTDGPGWDDLPERLQGADRPVASPAGAGDPPRRGAALGSSRTAGDNPVARDLGRIAAAFAGR